MRRQVLLGLSQSPNQNRWHSGTDPYEGSNDYHRCWGKIMRILEITGVLLDHESITWLCEDAWGCSSAEEFYEKMSGMSKEELTAWAEKARKRKRMADPLLQEQLLSAYA